MLNRQLCTRSLLSVLTVFVLLFLARPVWAVPSFARQTGQACASCHVQSFGPNLTPYGRDFKLNGYVAGDAANAVPLLSAMIQGSFTHTEAPQPGGPEGNSDYNANNNFSLDEAAIFVAGRILPKVGAFLELTYEGPASAVFLDNADIRFANSATLMNQDVVYGLSLNNSPTVQDLWNTLPIWGFPFETSLLAPAPMAGALLDDAIAGQVVGATAYSMINNLIYVEAGAYASMSRDVQRGLGTFSPDQRKLAGGAPYWRMVLQEQWGQHYVAVGHFGMQANTYPGRDESSGQTDTLTDLGFDWTYQYFGPNNTHIAELKGAYLHEEQQLRASQALGLADNAIDRLNTLRVNAAYTYEQTYGLTFGYFDTTGTRDRRLYPAEDIAGSANGKPDSNGIITELVYTPFGRQGSLASPWLNLRFALQYTHYFDFNGRNRNYDAAGRNAEDNDTLLVHGWFIF